MERTDEYRAKCAAWARLALKYKDAEEVRRRLEELRVEYPIRFARGAAQMDEREYELELYYTLSKYE